MKMESIKKTIVLSISCVVLSFKAFAIGLDGELPPLMIGEAIMEDGSAEKTSLELPNGIRVINNVASFKCINNYEMKIDAQGLLKLGFRTKVNVDGVCLDPTTGDVEYVGKLNGQNVRLEGTLFEQGREIILDGTLNIQRLSLPLTLSSER